MKKIILFSVLAGLQVALTLAFSNAFAQVKLGSLSFSGEVPVVEEYNYHLKDSKHSYDSSITKNTMIGLSGVYTLYPNNVSPHGDTIAFSTLNLMNLLEGTTIFFIRDTITKQIKQLSMKDEYNHGYGSPSITSSRSFIFSSLDYEIFGDTLFVRSFGAKCREGLISASDSYRYSNGYPNYTGEDDQIIKILEDTASYQCYIALVFPQPVNSVQESNVNQKIINISTSLPDHSIHFSFPSSDHSKPLLLYDILGREVKRIEIPSGVSEYRLQRDGFVSGYYFARLGSQTAKFVVN